MIFFIIGFVISLIDSIILYACCRVSGRISRCEEERWSDAKSH